MFPEDVLTDIARGKDFYSGLNAENIANLERGCTSCSVKNYKCLKRLLRSLDFKVELDEYDDIAKEIVKDMLIIIGDYTIQVPPTVDAGGNQSVPISDSAYFSATIVPGSAAITNIIWTIVSGTGTLTNANTANVIVDGFSIGGTVLKIEVTDANGRKASDTVILTGTAATEKVFYLFSDVNTLPTEEEILAAAFINIVPGILSYTVPVNSNDVKFVFVFQSIYEPNKGRWEDIIDTDRNGFININGTWNTTNTVGDYTGYATQFKTQFDNPIKFIYTDGGGED